MKKNPLGRYKKKRRIGWQEVELFVEHGKVYFKTKSPYDTKYSNKSGLFSTPKEALSIAKNFIKN